MKLNQHTALTCWRGSLDVMPRCVPKIAGNNRQRHVLDQGGKAEPACRHSVMILVYATSNRLNRAMT